MGATAAHTMKCLQLRQQTLIVADATKTSDVSPEEAHFKKALNVSCSPTGQGLGQLSLVASLATGI